jgi:hypothetical protein
VIFVKEPVRQYENVTDRISHPPGPELTTIVKSNKSNGIVNNNHRRPADLAVLPYEGVPKQIMTFTRVLN